MASTKKTLEIDDLRQLKLKLDAAHERYANFYDFAPVAYLTLNQTGEILEANLKACELLCLERARLLGQKFPRFVAVEAQDTFQMLCRIALGSAAVQGAEFELMNAQARRLFVYVEAVCAATTPQKQYRLSIIDITERKQAEERIVQLNRAQTILGGIDRAIIYASDQQKFLDEVCRVTVEKGGFKLAWIGMVAPDGSVQPVARAGVIGYLNGIHVMVSSDLPEGRGPIGTAIRENRPVIIKDVDLDARMIPWLERLQKFGLHYAAVFPIRIENKVTGSLQVYAPCADFFNKDEVALLTQVSDDISFALTAMADSKARKQAEEQLRKLSRAVEQSPVSIIITELTGAIEYVNPKFTELTGYTAQEVCGKNPRLLKSGEMPAGEYQQLWQTITQGREWHGEFHNRKKNGELFWEAASISPITNADGKITHFVAVKEDITERKQAEEALRRSQQRYVMAERATNDGLWEWNILSDEVYLSPRWKEIIGYREEELLDRKSGFLNNIHPNDRAAVDVAVREHLERGERYALEFRLRHKDGTYRWVFSRGEAQRDAAGRPISMVGATTDISERKHAEEAIRSERDRLEREVLRSIEMEQERIGRDLHDGLCQILVGAKYRIGVLEKMLTDKNVPSAAAEAKVVERMLNETIQQARDLARGLNPVMLAAKGLAFALEELAREVQTAGIASCSCELCPTTSIDDGDVVNHLYRISQEAVQNAVKHGKAKNIFINLREQAGTLVLSVEDDGVGFSTNPEKSVGAGLYNIRTRAEMIGATLAIGAAPHGGSVLSVSLPAKVT